MDDDDLPTLNEYISGDAIKELQRIIRETMARPDAVERSKSSSKRSQIVLLYQMASWQAAFKLPVQHEHFSNGLEDTHCLEKHRRQIAFSEIKTPKDSHTVREYLLDTWKSALYAKDALGLSLKEDIPITKTAEVQLFRHRLCLYGMEYAHGLLQ
ncbi:MAG: hypothetical protein J3Q66DRAFT_400890 [Benniella sp.]|nr:MAG: hypothetical protein J3Q66DRAFT_400890 [Benniella sp.]